MNDERMQALAGQVRSAAEQISRELGWDAPIGEATKANGAA